MEFIMGFIRKRETPAHQNEYGWNVIHTSTWQDHVTALSNYIEKYPTLINEGNIYGVTALHLAIRWNRIKCLEILLQQSNINVNVADEDGCTPVHDAARLNRSQCLELLLCHTNVMTNVSDNYGLTPIFYTAMSGHVECLKLLLKKDQSALDCDNYYTGCNLLHNLVRYGHSECLSIFLEENININISDFIGSTPLHYAAMFGQSVCLELLLYKGHANVNTVNHYGYTALYCAIARRKSECAMKLIECPNINVDIRNKHGLTHIHLAITWNELEVIKELIDKRHAKTDIPDLHGWICEHKAAAEGKIDILQILYDRNLINIYAKTNDGHTLLEFAYQQKKTLKFLMKMSDKYGLHLIQHAAIQLHEKLFQLLITQKCKTCRKKLFPPNKLNSRYSIKGRNSDLNNIDITREKHKNIVVYGPGGIGKTALVKFYSWYHHSFYSNLIWIDCQSQGSIKKSFVEAAKFLRIPTKRYEIDRELTLVVKDIFIRLQKKPSLIVFDNVSSVNIIETYARDFPDIHIIFITRQNIFHKNDIKCIQLGPVTEAAAIEFFDALFLDKILQETDRETIALLTRKLKYIPIALVAAKFYIMTDYLNLDLTQYIQDLENEMSKLQYTYITEFVNDEFNQIIYSTFIVTLDKLSICDLLAAAICLDPIYLDVRSLMQLGKVIYNKLVLERICAYIRNFIIEISNNNICINTFVRNIILYHPNYKVNLSDCYKNILNFLLSGDYSHHYEHVFKLSFNDNIPVTKILFDLRYSKILKPLVRYSYTKSLSKLFTYMNLSEIHEYVKKYKLLQEAIKSGNIRTLKLIFQYDNNIKGTDEIGHTMIWQAVDKNYSEILSFLIDKGATFKHIDKLNKTPLHRAAFLGKTEIVKFLLEKGADPNVRNKFQRTPLHYAAMEGHNDVIEELLKNKDTDINARDHYRRSPVFETVRCYQIETLKLFIRKGAKIHTKDNLDLSPVRLAKLQKNKIEILNVFKEYGFYTEPVTKNSCNIFC